MHGRLTWNACLTAVVVLWKNLWLPLRLRGSAVGVPLKLCSPASPASASAKARLPAVLMLPMLLPSAASAGPQWRCLSGIGCSVASAFKYRLQLVSPCQGCILMLRPLRDVWPAQLARQGLERMGPNVISPCWLPAHSLDCETMSHALSGRSSGLQLKDIHAGISK